MMVVQFIIGVIIIKLNLVQLNIEVEGMLYICNICFYINDIIF